MVRGRGSDNLHAHSMSARWEARLPVVYIFYAEQSHGLQHWMWNSIRLTVRRPTAVQHDSDHEHQLRHAT